MNRNLVNILTERVVDRLLQEANYRKVDNIDTFGKNKGRRPTGKDKRVERIKSMVKKYGLSSKIHHNDISDTIEKYEKVITWLGCEFSCHEKETTNDRLREFDVQITYEDGMTINGYIRVEAQGDEENPFKEYTTSLLL